MTVKTILVDDSKTVAELTKAVCDRIGELSVRASVPLQLVKALSCCTDGTRLVQFNAPLCVVSGLLASTLMWDFVTKTEQQVWIMSCDRQHSLEAMYTVHA